MTREMVLSKKYRSWEITRTVPLVVADVILQPDGGVEVQVVGGLVQRRISVSTRMRRARLIRVFSPPERSAKSLARKALSMPRPVQIFSKRVSISYPPPASKAAWRRSYRASRSGSPVASWAERACICPSISFRSSKAVRSTSSTVYPAG